MNAARCEDSYQITMLFTVQQYSMLHSVYLCISHTQAERGGRRDIGLSREEISNIDLR
jgi:hypothetical protein